MRLEASSARSFDRSTSVWAYWLARCEGFEVRSGSRHGVVEEVSLDVFSERAAYLVVRFGGRRRHMVTPESVRTVVPAEELLVLDPVEGRAPRLAPVARRAGEQGAQVARTGARVSTQAASTSARAAGSAAALAWHGTARGSAAAWRGTARGSSATWRELQRAARWFEPRAASATRATGLAIRGAAVAVATTAAAAARRVRADGPPAARAFWRRAAGTAALLRSRFAQSRETGRARRGSPAEDARPESDPEGGEDESVPPVPPRAA